MKEEKYRVPDKGKISLKDYDPNDASLFDGNKSDGKEALLMSRKQSYDLAVYASADIAVADVRMHHVCEVEWC